jgi:hypothetical protein
MKNLVIIILTVVVGGCSLQSPISLKDDMYVNDIFNNKEISELEGLINALEMEVINDGESKDIHQSYLTYIENMKLPDEEPIISFEKMDTNLFHKIWEYRYVHPPGINDSLKTIYINRDGVYFEFLANVAKNDSTANQYFLHFEELADFHPLILIDGSKKHLKKLDFNLDRNKLILAINLFYYNEAMRLQELNRKKYPRYYRINE